MIGIQANYTLIPPCAIFARYEKQIHFILFYGTVRQEQDKLRSVCYDQLEKDGCGGNFLEKRLCKAGCKTAPKNKDRDNKNKLKKTLWNKPVRRQILRRVQTVAGIQPNGTWQHPRKRQGQTYGRMPARQICCPSTVQAGPDASGDARPRYMSAVTAAGRNDGRKSRRTGRAQNDTNNCPHPRNG